MASENEKDGYDDLLNVRLYKDDLSKFKQKSNGLNKPYQVMLREIIDAFNTGRLKIIPTDEQKASLEIYQN